MVVRRPSLLRTVAVHSSAFRLAKICLPVLLRCLSMVASWYIQSALNRSNPALLFDPSKAAVNDYYSVTSRQVGIPETA